MMRLSEENNEAVNRAISSFDEADKLTQLQNALKPLPAREQERFMPAATQAAYVLELLSPGILAPMSDMLIAGVYSEVHPDGVVLIAASPEKALYAVEAIANLDARVEDALARFEECEVADQERTNLCGCLIVRLLKDHGFIVGDRLPAPLDMPVFNELITWRARSMFDPVRQFQGVAAALVTLVSAKTAEGDFGCLIAPIWYARHAPAELDLWGKAQ